MVLCCSSARRNQRAENVLHVRGSSSSSFRSVLPDLQWCCFSWTQSPSGISHSHRLLHAALTFVRVLRELTSSNFKSGHGLWFYLRSSCFSLDFLTFREVILHLPGSNWSFPMLTNYLLFSLWLAFRNVRKAANIYSNNLCEQLWIAWIIRATCWVCESLRSLNVMDLVRWSLHN